MRKRWQARRAAFAQGLLGEGEIALFSELDQQRMVGQMSLDDHLARLLGTPRTPGHLHNQLRHALAGAEVTGKQPAVGIQNRHQRHTGKVMPFGEHLRADQNAWLTALDGREQLVHGVLARGAVTIHA